MKTKALPFLQIERWVLALLFVTIILANVVVNHQSFSHKHLSLYFAHIFIPMTLVAAAYAMHFWLIPRFRKPGKRFIPILWLILLFLASLGITTIFADSAGYREEEFLPLYFGAVATYAGYMIVTYVLNQMLRHPNEQNFTVYNVIRLVTIYLFVILFVMQISRITASFVLILFVVILPSILAIVIYHYLLIYLPKKAGNIRKHRFFLILLPFLILAMGLIIMKANDLHPVTMTFTLVATVVTMVIILPVSRLLFEKYESYLGQITTLTARADQSTANLSFLRAQINPHFLFNTLNTLYGTALQEGSERTASGIQKLGDMMRFMLHENTKDRIPLSREIDYLVNYVDLQELRIQGIENADLSFHRPADSCSGEIAPMLLIPFVENAFKHGISTQRRCWVRISLRCLSGSVHLDVTNSIHRTKPSDPEYEASGVGLRNVKERLNLLYPNKHELVIRENELEFFVHLSVKL